MESFYDSKEGGCLAFPRNKIPPSVLIFADKNEEYGAILVYGQQINGLEDNKKYNLMITLDNNTSFQTDAYGYDGNYFTKDNMFYSYSTTNGFFMKKLSSSNIDDLARANFITVKAQGLETLPKIPLKEADLMISTLRKCVQEKL